MNEEEYQLVREIRDNPEEGIRQAINKYGPAVKTICRNILREYGDWTIEEAMQDSFVKLWKSITEGKIAAVFWIYYQNIQMKMVNCFLIDVNYYHTVMVMIPLE